MADWWQADKPVDAPAGGDWWKGDANVGAKEAAAAHQQRVATQALEDVRLYNQPDTRPGAGIARLAEGAAAGIVGLGLGVGQRLGLVDQQTINQYHDESAMALGNPLGFIGSMFGQAGVLKPVAMLAEPAGAAATSAAASRGAGAVVSKAAGGFVEGSAAGAAGGAATPTLEGESALKNTAVGAAGGGLVGALGGALAAKAQQNNLALANTQAANNVRDQAAIKASKLGYTLDPAASNPDSGFNSKLEGTFSGKFLTEKTASQRNQPITNAVVKEALTDSQGTVRFPEDSPLTPDNLDSFRSDVVRAKYEPLKQLGNMPTGGPNGPLAQLVSQAGAKVIALGNKFQIFKEAATDLNKNIQNIGGQTVLNADDAITLLSEYRSQASHMFQQSGKPGAPRSVGQTAAAYQEIADAIEQFLEIRAQMTAGTYQQTGNPVLASQWADTLNQFREGRQLIARSLDVQRTLTPAGNVDARVLANMAAKGKPLGGGLEHVAEIAAQFPKIVQPADRIGSVPEMSAVDLMIGGGSKIATGRFKTAAMVFARPAVRRLIMSNLYQNSLGFAHATYAPETLAPRLASVAPTAAAATVPQGLEVFNGQ